MVETQSTSIIHKMARSGREEFDARAMSPSKALRLALAKSADTLFDMALSVITVEQKEMTTAAIPRKLEAGGLLILLDGAGGRRGAVRLDPQLTAALIEAQIIGEVRGAVARDRPYTRTDAAMAAPFLEAVLGGFDTQLAAHDEGYIPVAMRFGDLMEDARVLGMALEGAEYDMFRVSLDLAEGAKTGVITLLLPQRRHHGASHNTAAAGKAKGFGSLEKSALDATATLDAVLARITMPLKDICALTPGMILNIPSESLSASELYAPKKHLVAEVRLGQMNGQRAVRLILDDHFKPPPAETDPQPAAALSPVHCALEPTPAPDPQEALHDPLAEQLTQAVQNVQSPAPHAHEEVGM